jgi:hypothetical protein
MIMLSVMRRNARRFAIALPLLMLVAAACGDDPVAEEDPAEAVVAMRLTIGTQTITVSDNGTVTGGPIMIPVGNTAITAAFLDDANQVVTGLDAEFRLDVTTNNANVATFTATSAFAGNLTGVAAGQTILEFALFHIEENHEDFGYHDVPVTVQ